MNHFLLHFKLIFHYVVHSVISTHQELKLGILSYQQVTTEQFHSCCPGLCVFISHCCFKVPHHVLLIRAASSAVPSPQFLIGVG